MRAGLGPARTVIRRVVVSDTPENRGMIDDDRYMLQRRGGLRCG